MKTGPASKPGTLEARSVPAISNPRDDRQAARQGASPGLRRLPAGGAATPAGEGIVPTGLGKWYNTDLEVVPFDIDQARKVLEEAGYGWDSDGRLHFPPG